MCGKAVAIMLPHARKCSNLAPSNMGSDICQDVIREMQSEKENVLPHYHMSTPPASPISADNMALYSGTSTPARRPLQPSGSSSRLLVNSSAENPEAGWTHSLHEEFNEDMCRLLIANNSPWAFANNPQTRLFMQKWVKGSQLVNARVLSDHVLDKVSHSVERTTREKIEGKKGTGQCDGLKNTAKAPVITSMITVENKVKSKL